MVADEVLTLLHRQLLPLPKGVNVGVVKNICASNETTNFLVKHCESGSHGKTPLPMSILSSALASLLIKPVSFIPKKRLSGTFSLLPAAASNKHKWEKKEVKGTFHSIMPVQLFSGLVYPLLDYTMILHWKASQSPCTGHLKPSAKRGTYRQTHCSELDCWCPSQNARFCKSIVIRSKMHLALTQRVTGLHRTTAVASSNCPVGKRKWNPFFFLFRFSAVS